MHWPHWFIVLATCGMLVGQQAKPALAAPCTQMVGRIEHIDVTSRQFGSSVPTNVYLPPCGGTRGLPIIYLLHGASADETQWPDLNVQSAADALIASGTKPFVVVMPGGEYRSGVDYADFLLSELMPFVEQHYATSGKRTIGGLSLGGYWALRIAFLNPRKFAAVGGHSPVVTLGKADDPFTVVRAPHAALDFKSMRIWLDAGDADVLRKGAAELAQTLTQNGVAVSFVIQPGRHNRVYWRMHTLDYLKFYSAALTGTMTTATPSAPGTH